MRKCTNRLIKAQWAILVVVMAAANPSVAKENFGVFSEEWLNEQIESGEVSWVRNLGIAHYLGLKFNNEIKYDANPRKGLRILNDFIGDPSQSVYRPFVINGRDALEYLEFEATFDIMTDAYVGTLRLLPSQQSGFDPGVVPAIEFHCGFDGARVWINWGDPVNWSHSNGSTAVRFKYGDGVIRTVNLPTFGDELRTGMFGKHLTPTSSLIYMAQTMSNLGALALDTERQGGGRVFAEFDLYPGHPVFAYLFACDFDQQHQFFEDAKAGTNLPGYSQNEVNNAFIGTWSYQPSSCSDPMRVFHEGNNYGFRQDSSGFQASMRLTSKPNYFGNYEGYLVGLGSTRGNVGRDHLSFEYPVDGNNQMFSFWRCPGG